MSFNLVRQYEEFRALWKLAAPIVLGQLLLMGIGVTDVIVAGRAGVEDLAGVTLGNNIWTLVIYSFFGISIANQPLIAEHFGKGNWRGLRKQFHQSIWMALLTGLAGICVVLMAAISITFLNIDQGVQKIAYSYILIMAIAAPAMTLIPVLKTTLESINKPKTVLLINFVAFMVNIPLDIAMVHGAFGLPGLGGVGCALASVFVLWLSVLITYLFICSSREIRKLRLTRKLHKPDRKMILSTMKLGVPIGFSILIELGFFNGAAIVIATLGEVEIAAHAVAISAASIAYMLYFGIGQATTILGSQRIGAGDSRQAVYGIYFSIKLSVFFSLILTAFLVLYRYEIAALYSKDSAVIQLAGHLLIWSAVFQLMDAVQVNSICGLRAFKDTRSPPKYQIFAFWVLAFPLGVLLSVYEIFPAIGGPEGFWCAMVIGLGCAALLIFFKLRETVRRVC